MDLENCREEEQETRQKTPFPGGNNGLLLEPRESGPPEEKGRYACPTVQAVGPNVQNWAPPALSREECSLLMQIIFAFETIIPVIHYILLEHILMTLKSVSLCN